MDPFGKRYKALDLLPVLVRVKSRDRRADHHHRQLSSSSLRTRREWRSSSLYGVASQVSMAFLVSSMVKKRVDRLRTLAWLCCRDNLSISYGSSLTLPSASTAVLAT